MYWFSIDSTLLFSTGDVTFSFWHAIKKNPKKKIAIVKMMPEFF
jgi:hypothetical protein